MVGYISVSNVQYTPTRKGVRLLNQRRIIETVKKPIEEKLMNSNTTRTFQTQSRSARAVDVDGQRNRRRGLGGLPAYELKTSTEPR